MSDPDTLRALAPIAAERNGWPRETITTVEEHHVEKAWQQAAPRTKTQRALTELLATIRKEAQT